MLVRRGHWCGSAQWKPTCPSWRPLYPFTVPLSIRGNELNRSSDKPMQCPLRYLDTQIYHIIRSTGTPYWAHSLTNFTPHKEITAGWMNNGISCYFYQITLNNCHLQQNCLSLEIGSTAENNYQNLQCILVNY